jgi:hypothetical protein
MFESLTSFFAERPETPAEPEQPPRDSATIRAELGMARDSVTPLAEKLAIAQRELSEAQQQYDAGIQGFALGHTPVEPDRGALAAAGAKSDALRRISVELDRSIKRLASELAASELAEVVAAGGERLQPLVVAAEACLDEFQRAVIAAKQAENALFEVLFNERSGLKQTFVGDDNSTIARKTRFTINREAQATAQQCGYRINSRFETDGEVNLGAEYAETSVYALYAARAEMHERSSLRERAASTNDR